LIVLYFYSFAILYPFKHTNLVFDLILSSNSSVRAYFDLLTYCFSMD
jgi:hypothetical protein